MTAPALRGPALVLAITASVLCIAVPGLVRALPESNRIEFRNCTLVLPGTTRTTQARCGWLEVPEDPSEPDGRLIKLHIGLAPAVARKAAADPLFVFAGGPGQAASEAYVMLQPILESIRKQRDIVLIDQRGTGLSNPLKCPVDDSETFETSIDLERIGERARECLAGLQGDPRFYTSTIAMQDYERVREAMGYDRINLYGGSYGTRTAQVYLRMFPQHVRSMILDSVVPMDLVLGTEHGAMLDRSVAETFSACSRDPECSSRFAGVEALGELFRDLRRQPREIRFIHPATGVPETLSVTADVLAVAIRFLSYSSETQAVLPLLVHDAVNNGNLQRLASQAWMVMSGLSEQISHGMELSVICSEDFPFMQDADSTGDTLLGDSFLAAMKTECAIWPHGDVPDGFHDPVTSDIPVLIMTGTRDPVTPPLYAERVARGYPNSVLLQAEGLGHSVITHVCLRDIATRFVTQGTVTDLDTGCIGDIRPAPFFTSILGPNP